MPHQVAVPLMHGEDELLRTKKTQRSRIATILEDKNCAESNVHHVYSPCDFDFDLGQKKLKTFLKAKKNMAFNWLTLW